MVKKLVTSNVLWTNLDKIRVDTLAAIIKTEVKRPIVIYINNFPQSIIPITQTVVRFISKVSNIITLQSLVPGKLWAIDLWPSSAQEKCFLTTYYSSLLISLWRICRQLKQITKGDIHYYYGQRSQELLSPQLLSTSPPFFQLLHSIIPLGLSDPTVVHGPGTSGPEPFVKVIYHL